MHHAKKRAVFPNTISEGRGIRTAAVGEDQAMQNQQVIDLLHVWLADESGYDERVWPEVKNSIEEHRLGRRKRFAR